MHSQSQLAQASAVRNYSYTLTRIILVKQKQFKVNTMKKTLVALAVSAFAVSSASAITLYENDGTTVSFDGSVRFVLEQANKKSKDAAGTERTAIKTHSNLRNAGSRMALRFKHEINDDLYALGRVEVRFRSDDTTGSSNKSSGFGDLYTKRAYAGLGSKTFGEVTFGRQLTIADDYGLTKDYEYGMVPKSSYIETEGESVIRYDYFGIEGLQIGLNYNFPNSRSNGTRGEVPVDEIKNAYGIGATYSTEVAPNQTFIVKGGYGRSSYVTGTSDSHHKDGVILSLGYKIDNLTLVNESGYKHEKNGSVKTNGFYVSPGAIYQVTPEVSVYGNYIYERLKHKDAGLDTGKEKTHGFLAGVDYRFHKQVVAFVEGTHKQTKEYTGSSTYTGKTTDKAIGVGMRVFW